MNDANVSIYATASVQLFLVQPNASIAINNSAATNLTPFMDHMIIYSFLHVSDIVDALEMI